MPLVPDVNDFQAKLEGLPVRKYEAGENVLSAVIRTGSPLATRPIAIK